MKQEVESQAALQVDATVPFHLWPKLWVPSSGLGVGKMGWQRILIKARAALCTPSLFWFWKEIKRGFYRK